MIKHPIHRDYLFFIPGVIISLIANILFYVNNSSRPIGTLQYIICIKVPGVITLILAAIGFVIVGLLKGKTENRKWGHEQAKDILVKEKTHFRRILAKTYLIVINPGYFLCGWLIGSFVFLAFTYEPTALIGCLIGGVLYYFISRKFAQAK